MEIKDFLTHLPRGPAADRAAVRELCRDWRGANERAHSLDGSVEVVEYPFVKCSRTSLNTPGF